MAVDDDDDFFGDFKFAPKPETNFSAVAASIPADSFDDDDDWGDFVTTRSDQIDGEKAAEVSRIDLASNWVKPSGALPLSLFGETEDEKEEEMCGAGESRLIYGDLNWFGGEKKKGPSLNGGVVIGDLIADLYGQSDKIKVQNEPGPNSNANSSDRNENGFDFGLQLASSSSSKLDSCVGGSNSNEFCSNLAQQSENFDDDDEDYGWEFKVADGDKQEQQAVEAPGPKAETVAGKDREIQVDGVGRVKIEESKPTIEFSNGPDGLVDTMITSNGAGDWNYAFDADLNPVSKSQDHLLRDSYSESNGKSDTKIESNLSLVVENENSNNKFWQFEDVFSRDAAEPKLEAAKPFALADLGVQAKIGDGHGPTNFFAASEETFHRPKAWDFSFTFNSNFVNEVITVADETYKSKTSHTNESVSFCQDDEHDESEDNLWEFKDAFSETGSKNEEESMVTLNPPANLIPQGLDGANQDHVIKSGSNREPLPLSLFGDELETNASLVDQDVSTHSTYTRNSHNNSNSNVSINDLISSLYGQAEKSISLNAAPKASENEPHITNAMESDLVHPDDDFNDESWEFKDASWGEKAPNQAFVPRLEESPTKSSTKLRLDGIVDFYCKLKDESCYIALSHCETVKKVQSSAFEALGEETQKFYDELCRDNMISEFHLENLSQRSSSISELLKVLHEPKFRFLESKYHLSSLLSLAEKDLGSAIKLSRHITSTLRILKLGSAAEQSTYVSTWFKIVSVCAKELKHGASIWEQAVQKDVADQILSEPQGKRYVAALGEIYRVVQVLGASVKLYEPWILLYSLESDCLCAILNECSTLWSTSGLDEALERVSESTDSELDGTLTELLECIEHIQSLDALSLHDSVFSGKQPLCRLSMLTPEVLPGVKLVIWDGDQYLLKLANLWANLISSYPPDLPRLIIS